MSMPDCHASSSLFVIAILRVRVIPEIGDVLVISMFRTSVTAPEPVGLASPTRLASQARSETESASVAWLDWRLCRYTRETGQERVPIGEL